MCFRFLNSRGGPSDPEIGTLLEVDHRRGKRMLAFDPCTGELVAGLTVIADPGVDAAEVAIAVASDTKGRGIGRTPLRHARARGAIHGPENRRCFEDLNPGAPEVEHTQGFLAGATGQEPGQIILEADVA